MEEVFFLINQSVWSKICSMVAYDFEDSNITDDINYAKRLYKANENIDGNGFVAWGANNKLSCGGNKLTKYGYGCF